MRWTTFVQPWQIFVTVMGMIIDLEFPAVATALPKRNRRRTRVPRIEADTPLVPHAVATGVWEEASVWLGEELPREWADRLTARADAVYAHAPHFRQKMRASGNKGRDWLWAFTRHWLAARIQKYRPDLYARLPAGYNVGGDLPR